MSTISDNTTHTTSNETNSHTTSYSYARMNMATDSRASNTHTTIDDMESFSSMLTTITTASSLTSLYTTSNDSLVSSEDEHSSSLATTTDSWTECDLGPIPESNSTMSNWPLYIQQTPWELDSDTESEDAVLNPHCPTITLTTLTLATLSSTRVSPCRDHSVPLALGENLVIQSPSFTTNELIMDPTPWTRLTLVTRLLTRDIQAQTQDTPWTKLSTAYPRVEIWGGKKAGYATLWRIDRVFRNHGVCIRGFGLHAGYLSGLARLVWVPVFRLEAASEVPVRAWRGAVREVGLAGGWDLGLDGEGQVEVDVDVDVDFGRGWLDIDGLTFSSSSSLEGGDREERARECWIYVGGRG
ncbi:hypothetical protein BDV32DRAFT_155189 [Aspergillus pseudonomiae]|uniref:Uncharacterized protein n=1 Tax=Aspergillus pseudonomiae TaxID=1506151 RepID=A0A5N7CUI2_9EURO|nr:uncharacterized protein BDV37DRAFT_289072 [Aspergillus pseudonomiae]KAB8254479.1 hypothetical protein BDV32DRAFT_155189 [Aspergillus pseudonomiae]KAE8397850.1 hypothetical protein BDV37DRAFT_289072 [Aspergillus pseudonomiae]